MRTQRPPSLRYLGPAGMAVVVVEIALRATSLPRLCRLLGVRLATASAGSAGLAHPASVSELGSRDATAFRVAYRLVGVLPWARTTPCLRAALVAGRLLRHRRPTLQLGAALVDGRVVAHAWLVVDDLVLDPTARDYATFSGLGG